MGRSPEPTTGTGDVIGIGDWILASGEAKEVNIATGKKVIFGNGKKRFYDKNIFKDNPRIAGKDEDGVWIPDYPGSRPYIRTEKNGRMIFDDAYRPKVGELFGIRKSEKLSGKILVETRTKKEFVHTVNKAYPYWDALISTGLPIVKVQQVETARFRDALSLLAGASLFVGTDGALHHAAAALGVPAVVIWTGYSSPRHLGYETQVNIHDGSEPCGTFSKVCQHCLRKAKSIDPDYVNAVVRSEFEKCAPITT